MNKATRAVVERLVRVVLESPRKDTAYARAKPLLAHLRTVPDAPGMVLVPVEPTEAMHVAAVRAAFKAAGNSDFPLLVWKAMIAASKTEVKS